MRQKGLLALLLIAVSASAAAQGRSGSRAGTNEFYLSPIFTQSKSYSFEGGTTAKTDTAIRKTRPGMRAGA